MSLVKGDLLSKILSIVILAASIDGKKTIKIISSKKIKFLLYVSTNNKNSTADKKLTPEFPVKIFPNKFAKRTNIRLIIIDK